MAPHKIAKKAAKKVPGKAAKKAAAKHARPKGHDLRRAFEHLHRIDLIHAAVPGASQEHVYTLIRMAQGFLLSRDDREAADLLRAAEHLTFGSLATTEAVAGVDEELTEAAHSEYLHLKERAQQHWGDRREAGPRGLRPIFSYMLREAKVAIKTGALHRALEMVRGAEALSHVEGTPARLPKGPATAPRLPA